MGTETIVVKYGGHAMEQPETAEIFLNDLAEMSAAGMKFVLAHGGGPMINRLLKRLDIKSNFVDGLRVTDAAILEVVEMALCGQVNKAVVRSLAKHGIRACGISGEDGNLLKADLKDARYGRVGKIVGVNPELVQCLLAGGFVPVLAPLALDGEGEILNINADTAAGALAGALGAASFILLSDVPGILDSNGRLFNYLSADAIAELCQSGVISGGMLPKVEACLGALKAGCKQAIILDSRQPGSLKRCLVDNNATGTVIAL